MSEMIPQAVLGEELQERLKGRRVRAAVFTTFTFDPGFFELHILPCLFDRPFSQIDKIRRIQLEDALRSVDEVAVYYDRAGLTAEAQPAQLDFRRFDVGRRTGLFHPKLMLGRSAIFPAACVDHGQAENKQATNGSMSKKFTAPSSFTSALAMSQSGKAAA